MSTKHWSENLPKPEHAEIPEGCLSCVICGERCMEAETVEPDWNGRGKVIRIFSMCDESMEKDNDDVRTEFGTVAEAVIEWNKMNRKE